MSDEDDLIIQLMTVVDTLPASIRLDFGCKDGKQHDIRAVAGAVPLIICANCGWVIREEDL